jgi:trehalose/maltose hydrolase-like predicted phosphorylase
MFSFAMDRRYLLENTGGATPRYCSESGLDARLAVATATDFAELLSSHQRAWQRARNRCDIEMDSANEWSATMLHLHIFHLLQTVSPRRAYLDVGVPARGWHGEAYRGHIFWDELFIFPYINFQRPWLAAALIDYRYARLGAARAAARDEGFAGAMFPWQSGSNGREETHRWAISPIELKNGLSLTAIGTVTTSLTRCNTSMCLT